MVVRSQPRLDGSLEFNLFHLGHFPFLHRVMIRVHLLPLRHLAERHSVMNRLEVLWD
jgi:hypothetical protein